MPVDSWNFALKKQISNAVISFWQQDRTCYIHSRNLVPAWMYRNYFVPVFCVSVIGLIVQSLLEYSNIKCTVVSVWLWSYHEEKCKASSKVNHIWNFPECMYGFISIDAAADDLSMLDWYAYCLLEYNELELRRTQLWASQHYTNIDWCRGQHWKIMSRSCLSIIFQCWSRLTVSICFVISRNKCNKFVSSSVEQQHRICIDELNTAAKPKNWHRRHVPREHGAALTKLGIIVYFCTSRDLHWTNHDLLIQIVM